MLDSDSGVFFSSRLLTPLPTGKGLELSRQIHDCHSKITHSNELKLRDYIIWLCDNPWGGGGGGGGFTGDFEVP